LNAVFRGFHTLKGGAGFLGIQPMVELCHAAEETLGAARSGQAVLDPLHFDAAQRSLDWLKAMLDAVAAGTEPEHAPPELIAQFALTAAAPAPAPVQAAPVPAASAATGSDDLITDDEFEALLDQLHGAAAPGASALAAKPTPTPAPAASDEISEDEFEALLDQLHGKAAPGANPVPAAAPAAATAVATPPRAPARPAPDDGPPARPSAPSRQGRGRAHRGRGLPPPERHRHPDRRIGAGA